MTNQSLGQAKSKLVSAGQQQQFLNATNAAGLGIYQSSEQTAAAANKESQQQQVLNAHQAIDRVKHMHELKMRRELAIKLQGADKTGDILKSNISSEDEDKIRHNLMYKKIDDIKEFQDKTKMVAQQIVLESQNQDNSDPDLLFVREILNEHRSENMKFFKKVVNKCKRNKSNPRKKFQRRSSKKKHSV